MLSQLGSRSVVRPVWSVAFVSVALLVLLLVVMVTVAMSTTGPMSLSSEVFIPTLVFPESG
jgi:hypothetical protein